MVFLCPFGMSHVWAREVSDLPGRNSLRLRGQEVDQAPEYIEQECKAAGFFPSSFDPSRGEGVLTARPQNQGLGIDMRSPET